MENIYLSFLSKEVQFAYPFPLFFLNCCARTCMSKYMTEVHNYQNTSHYRGLSDHVLSSHVVHLALWHRKKIIFIMLHLGSILSNDDFPSAPSHCVVTPTLAARCQAELITRLHIRLKLFLVEGRRSLLHKCQVGTLSLWDWTGFL